jgi:uncharacterized DUF497 family protein
MLPERPEYTWSEVKRALNLANHEIDFTAADAFDWQSALIVEDTPHDYGETRVVAYGTIGPRLHVLVYTLRGDATHLISLRKANDREIRRYAQNNRP